MTTMAMLSMRNETRAPSRALLFETEDIFESLVETSERIDLSLGYTRPKILRNLNQYTPASLRPTPAPSGARVDLAFVDLMGPSDLCSVPNIDSFIARGRVSACYICEIWSSSVLARRGEMRWLRRFDHIFSGCAAAVEPLHKATGRPVEYVPPSVDTLRWCMPEYHARPVDVLWFGRRHPKTHKAILERANEMGWFYWHDTAGVSGVPDYRAHRENLAQLVNRSKIAIVQRAKVNKDSDTGTDEEIGFRYFECAAGGGTMVGDHPVNAYWDQLFGWKGAIQRVDLGSPEIADTIESLLDHPGNLRAGAIHNKIQCLRSHDAVHRWRQMMNAIGIERSKQETARLEMINARIAELRTGDTKNACVSEPAPSAHKAS